MRFRHALGEVLRETRHEQKLNLRDVAQRGCIALGYLSEIERGHKEVSSELLECIADGLGVPVSKLIEKTAIKIRLDEPLSVEDFKKPELREVKMDRRLLDLPTLTH
jgi:transcriptional regulator with XRE-family HTH domain